MMNRTAFLALMAAVLVLLAAASPAKADTLYSTSGTPPTYVTNSGFRLSGGYTFAEAFVPTETATLTDAIVPVGLNPDSLGGDAATVYIESSTAGQPSGTTLDTLTTTGTIVGSGDELLTFTCTVCSQLTSGTSYFIVVMQTGGSDVVSLLSGETFGVRAQAL
jgi:hypothetical protein